MSKVVSFFDGLWVPASIVKLFCRRHRNISVSHYGLVEKQSLSNSFCLPCLSDVEPGPSRGEKKSEARNLGCANKFLRLRLFRVYKIKFVRLLVLADSSTGFAVEYLASSLTHFIPLWLNMKTNSDTLLPSCINSFLFVLSLFCINSRRSWCFNQRLRAERLTESSSDLFSLPKSNHTVSECSGRVLIVWHYTRSQLTAAAVSSQSNFRGKEATESCDVIVTDNLSSEFRSWFRLPCRSEFVLITQTERQIRF